MNIEGLLQTVAGLLLAMALMLSSGSLAAQTPASVPLTNSAQQNHTGDTHGAISDSLLQAGLRGSEVASVAPTPGVDYFPGQSSDVPTTNPDIDTMMARGRGASAGLASNTYTVTAKSSANGTITPATQSVNEGAVASLTVIPNAGYHIDHVAGHDCNVSLDSGDTWTTDAITADCRIYAAFASNWPGMALSVNASRTHAHYGQLLTYYVTLTNAGNTTVSGASVIMALSPLLDADNTSWTCLDAGDGAICHPGTGPLNDHGVVLYPDYVVTWVVSTSVLPRPASDVVDTTVSVSDGTNSINASNRTFLVLFRDGFDFANGDGTQAAGRHADLAYCPTDPQAEPMDDTFLHQLVMPAASASIFDTLLTAKGSDGSGFRLERANHGDRPFIRLVTVEHNGHEHASKWVGSEVGATLTLVTAKGASSQRMLLLDGAASPLGLALPEGIGNLRVRGPAGHAGVCDQSVSNRRHG